MYICNFKYEYTILEHGRLKYAVLRYYTGGKDYDRSSIRGEGTKILVIGVGGAGNNAVNRMIDTNIQGIDMKCVNTDSQQLKNARHSQTYRLAKS